MDGLCDGLWWIKSAWAEHFITLKNSFKSVEKFSQMFFKPLKNEEMKQFLINFQSLGLAFMNTYSHDERKNQEENFRLLRAQNFSLLSCELKFFGTLLMVV